MSTRRTLQMTARTLTEKHTIEHYAQARGYRLTGDFLRVAIFEYIRRHKPAEGSALRTTVDDLLGE